MREKRGRSGTKIKEEGAKDYESREKEELISDK